MQRWVSATLACAWLLPAAVAWSATTASESTPELPVAQLTEADPSVVAVLRQAESLLGQGKSSEAHDLLTRHELDLAGSASFDYLLGVAALDSGKPKDAVFALERVVVSQPDFPGARIELARAQFESGAYALARDQFQFLLTQSPPESTRTVIQRYRDAAAERASLSGSRWSALAQFGGGYDSNANGSTNQQTFLGFTLDPRNVETESSFGELTLGGSHSIAVGSSGGLVSNAQVSHRANADASFIDQTVASLGTTALWGRGAYRFSSGLDGYAGWLDTEDHERGMNLNFGASRRLADYEGAVNLRAGTLDYRSPALQILDANRYLAGFSLTRLNLGNGTGRAGVALLAGVDDARQSGSPYGNNRFGARVFGSWLVRPRSMLLAEISHTRTDFDGSFFGASRKDDQLGLSVALDLQDFPAAHWSVAPRLRYLNNDSNISLYEYDRLEAVVFVRRGF
jgi:hypothetical protein